MPEQPIQQDLILYAGTLGRWMEGNAFKVMAGDILRTLNVMGTIYSKKKLAQMRIEMLNARVTQLEEAIESGGRPAHGQRLNKLR